MRNSSLADPVRRSLLGSTLAGVGLTVGTVASAGAQARPPAPGYASQPLRSNVILKSGRRLSFLDWGDNGKPLLLFVHGKGSGAFTYLDFAPHLTDRYRVLAVDLPGCGFSDWEPDGDYTVEMTIAELDQFAEALRLEPFILYGHSFGAVLSIAYAAMFPHRVRLLALEDGGALTRRDGSRPPLNPGQKDYAGAPAPRPADKIFPSWTAMVATMPAGPNSPPSPMVLESRFVRRADGTVHERADVQGLWKTKRGPGFDNPWPLIAAIKAPAILLRAERGLVPEPVAADMAAANPRLHYVSIAGAGHNAHIDKPAKVLRALRDFLAANGA